MRWKHARQATIALMLLPMMLCVQSCAANSPAVVTVDSCAGWHPVLGEPDDADRMSVKLLRAIGKHNAYGVTHCGWKL